VNRRDALIVAIQPSTRISRSGHGHNAFSIDAIDLKALGKKNCWEVSRDNALFPHLYGRLKVANVIAAIPLVRQPDGNVRCRNRGRSTLDQSMFVALISAPERSFRFRENLP
jgi:Protein of unknown function (DUF952)